MGIEVRLKRLEARSRLQQRSAFVVSDEQLRLAATTLIETAHRRGPKADNELERIVAVMLRDRPDAEGVNAQLAQQLAEGFGFELK
jgi:hypothetical protein